MSTEEAGKHFHVADIAQALDLALRLWVGTGQQADDCGASFWEELKRAAASRPTVAPSEPLSASPALNDAVASIVAAVAPEQAEEPKWKCPVCGGTTGVSGSTVAAMAYSCLDCQAVFGSQPTGTEQAEERCEVTSNPVGTDTWGNGRECGCAPCQRFVRRSQPTGTSESADRRAEVAELVKRAWDRTIFTSAATDRIMALIAHPLAAEQRVTLADVERMAEFIRYCGLADAYAVWLETNGKPALSGQQPEEPA